MLGLRCAGLRIALGLAKFNREHALRRYLATGALGLVLLAAALAWTILGDGHNPPGQSAQQGSARPDVAPPPPLPAPKANNPVAAMPPAAAPAAPSFDVVRIKPSGDAVIAGRATPGAEVTILDGGRELGKAAADARGEWVFLPAERLPMGSRALSLRAVDPDGGVSTSSQVVVLHVPDPAAPEGKPSEAKPSDAKPGDQAVALVAPREGGASRVLQAPPPAPEKKSSSPVSVDVVDYDGEGRLILSGRAAPGSEVVIYLNDRAAGRARADAAGDWRMTADSRIEPGDYRLRADQAAGAPGQPARVVARVEMPFTQIDFGKLAPAAGQDAMYVIVQPGDSLWRISRFHLGRGVQYTVIYQANKDQIRDPDLIYPGQVFAVPTMN
jgi:nucleoid-associated protein YgaU